MDLHLTEDQATSVEKAAVDGVLGLPKSGWEGGTRSELSGHAALANSTRRDQLLPVLHAIQSHAGWISPGALNYVAVRMNLPPAEIYGVASFYAMFSLSPRAPIVAHVCDDIACLARGAGELCVQLEKNLGAAGPSGAQNRYGLAPQSMPGIVRTSPRRSHFRRWRISARACPFSRDFKLHSVCVGRCEIGKSSGRTRIRSMQKSPSLSLPIRSFACFAASGR